MASTYFILLGFSLSILGGLHAQTTTAPDPGSFIQKMIEQISSSGGITSLLNTIKNSLPKDFESSCALDIFRLVNGIRTNQPWAFTMFDASGKPAPGFLAGATRWMGSYAQCMAIHDTASDGRTVQGDYCSVGITLPQNITRGMGLGAMGALTVYWDVCVPSSCSSKSISSMLRMLIQWNPSLSDTGISARCVRENKQNFNQDGVAIFATVFLGAFSIIIVFCTIIDGFGMLDTKEYSEDVKTHDNGYKNKAFEGEHSMENGRNASTEIGELQMNEQRITNGHIPKEEKQLNSKPAGTSVKERLVHAFSLYHNVPKLLGAKKTPGTLTCLNGIRVLSMAWVILGHTYVTLLPRATGGGLLDIDDTYACANCCSGLLVTYLYLKQLNKEGFKAKSLALFYFHRFWRLLPLYGATLLVYAAYMKYIVSGSVFAGGDAESEICRKYWWRNLLYINNFFKMSEMCNGLTWYLSNDMQMYIISPIVILPLFFFPVAGLVLIIGLMAVHIGVSAYELSVIEPSGGPFGELMDSFETVYIKPWCRVAPFAVGMAVAYILHKTDCKLKMNKVLLALMWIVGLGCIFVTVYVKFDDGQNGNPAWNRTTKDIYTTVHRPIWALGVGWLILACCTGHGGIINTILSWSAWIPLSRLTYGAYLTHMVLMSVYLYNRDTMIYYTDYTIVYLFLGNWALAYGAAFVFSVAFESPMMTLEKILLKK